MSSEKHTQIVRVKVEFPGQILKMQAFPIKDMLDLCIKIFDKIALASFYNTLTLSDDIAFKSEKDKYDFEVFFKTLLHISKVRAFNNEHNSIQEYMLTRDFYNRSFVRNIDKKMLFEIQKSIIIIQRNFELFIIKFSK
jgi:hypothetical protein